MQNEPDLDRKAQDRSQLWSLVALRAGESVILRFANLHVTDTTDRIGICQWDRPVDQSIEVVIDR